MGWIFLLLGVILFGYLFKIVWYSKANDGIAIMMGFIFSLLAFLFCAIILFGGIVTFLSLLCSSNQDFNALKNNFIEAIGATENISNIEENYETYYNSIIKILNEDDILNEKYQNKYSYHTYYINNINKINKYNNILRNRRSNCSNWIFGHTLKTISNYDKYLTDFKYIEITQNGYKLVDDYPCG